MILTLHGLRLSVVYPLGSVLGPLLFNIFINDIGSGIKSSILVFADDTKLCNGITSLQDVSNLQSDLNALFIGQLCGK